MNYYEILQVSPNASKEVIEMAYKALAKKYHPDLNSSENRIACEDYMKRINTAREVLTNDILRDKYDSSLNLRHSKTNDTYSNPNIKTHDTADSAKSYEENKDIDYNEMYKKMYTQMLEENKNDFKYRVRVASSSPIFIPNLCICCMGKADQKLAASYLLTNAFVKKNIYYEFPVCNYCISHSNDMKSKGAFVFWASTIISIVSVLIFKSISINAFIALALGVAINILMLTLFSIVLQANKLSKEHSEREEFIRILACNDKYVEFSFSNWMYANIVALNNNSSVQEYKDKRHTKHLSIITAGLYAKRLIAGSIVLVLFGSFLGYGMPPYDTSTSNEQVKQSDTTINSYSNEQSTTSSIAISNEETSLAPTVSNLPEKPLPQHGDLRVLTDKECVAPFEVKTSVGEYYYVKLTDEISGNDVITCFVYGGQTIKFDVPLGKYILKYAIISKWHGYDSDPIQDAECYKSDEVFDFKVDGNYVSGYTVTLYKVANGNMQTKEINSNNF